MNRPLGQLVEQQKFALDTEISTSTKFDGPHAAAFVNWKDKVSHSASPTSASVHAYLPSYMKSILSAG